MKWIQLMALLCLPMLIYAQHPGLSLTVNVHGLRSTKGVVIVSLFEKSDGFPLETKKAYMSKPVKASTSNITVTFLNLQKGVYAISVFHDENINGKPDNNFLHIPKEGVAVSNNVRKMGKPSFEEAKFTLSEDMSLNLNIIYIL